MTASPVRRFGSAHLHDGGFAYGAEVDAKSLIYTAGLSPLDEAGEVVAPDDPVAQVARTIACLDVLLAERGAHRDGVAKLTVYVVAADNGALGQVWQAVDAAFGGATPPAIVVGVTALPYPGQVVEIEAVVAVGSRS
ncbi:MAG: Rid family hydrolase [Gordonia sp. (in: high G+C Gram-positive bacteria)]|uniref:RidA family protein n=1 Tax=Gordonia TaxID=2053 RepID=UPI003266E8FE